MTRFLLDINVLLALMDPAHLMHESAHEWFRGGGMRAWATCPLTQNGVLRIAGHPKYPNSPGGPSAVAALLEQLVLHPGHRQWPDDISLLEGRLVERSLLASSGQITDVYLLALAVRQQGKLVTFDRRIPSAAVKGGRSCIELLG